MLLEDNPEFDFAVQGAPAADLERSFTEQLLSFREFGTATRTVQTQARMSSGDLIEVPTYVNEFWTARQPAFD